MSYLALHLRNQADAMYESAYPERVAKLYIAANRIEADEKTIERLTRELDAVIQQARIWSQEAKTQKATVNEVGAILGGIPDWGPISKNVAAVVKDAERYRYLRKDRALTSDSFWIAGGHPQMRFGRFINFAADEAIDAAISATTDGGKT
jgi:hypothetical protein